MKVIKVRDKIKISNDFHFDWDDTVDDIVKENLKDLQIDEPDESMYESADSIVYEEYNDLKTTIIDKWICENEYFVIDGVMHVFTGAHDVFLYMKLDSFDEFTDRLKDVDNISLDYHKKSNILEVHSCHHDGTNCYSIIPLINETKAELVKRIKDCMSKDQYRELKSDIRSMNKRDLLDNYFNLLEESNRWR